MKPERNDITEKSGPHPVGLIAKEKKSMNVWTLIKEIPQPVAVVLAAILALWGVVIGHFIGVWISRRTYEQKSDELFFKALDFLSGGSQKRNLGISAIELYWENHRHRKLCVSLLTGTAIYLLKESGQEDAAHELHNLDRIMRLLLEQKRIKDEQSHHYERLRDIIDERLRDSDPADASITALDNPLTLEAAGKKQSSTKGAKEIADAMRKSLTNAVKETISKDFDGIDTAVVVVVDKDADSIVREKQKGLDVPPKDLKEWKNQLQAITSKVNASG